MTITKAALGRGAHIAGAVATVAAIAAFAYAFAEVLSTDRTTELLRLHWIAFVAGLALYFTAFVPMTLAWIALARGCGAAASKPTLARIFLVSQIGKYLPGNVGQFIGRAYLANRAGIRTETSALAMALEVAGVLVAGSTLAGIASVFGLVNGESNFLPLLSGVMAVAALGGSLLLVRLRIGPIGRLIGPLVFALFGYLSVFVLLAGVNVALMGTLTSDWSWTLVWRVSAALVVSWLIGFLTPGAPAGLGLRELTFSALLLGAYPPEVPLLAAAGFRLTTMLGDVVALLGGLVIGRDASRRFQAA